jgi:hypothetical protein
MLTKHLPPISMPENVPRIIKTYLELCATFCGFPFLSLSLDTNSLILHGKTHGFSSSYTPNSCLSSICEKFLKFFYVFFGKIPMLSLRREAEKGNFMCLFLHTQLFFYCWRFVPKNIICSHRTMATASKVESANCFLFPSPLFILFTRYSNCKHFVTFCTHTHTKWQRERCSGRMCN